MSQNIGKLCQYIEAKRSVGPFGGSFFNNLSNWTSFCFPLSSGRGGADAWTGAVIPNVSGCCISSGFWSYWRRYGSPDWVPTGCEVAGYAAKASFSSSESLREAIVTASSSVARETILHNLPLSLGLLDSHCSSWTISEWTYMIFPDFVIIVTRP